jgi:hypothetical protein
MELDKKYLDMAKVVGMSDSDVRNLAYQFRAVYPDRWESLLEERLASSKEEYAEKQEIQELQGKERQLQVQLQAKAHTDLKKNLIKHIAELEKLLGREE